MDDLSVQQDFGLWGDDWWFLKMLPVCFLQFVTLKKSLFWWYWFRKDEILRMNKINTKILKYEGIKE